MYTYVISRWLEGGQHYPRLHILEAIPISRAFTLSFHA